MSNGNGAAAVDGYEDLGVPHALPTELRMNLASVLPHDSVERRYCETRKRTVVADDVVARPEMHEAILAAGIVLRPS